MPRRATRVDDFPNRDVLEDIAFGLYRATILKSAVEVEIFTRISEGHRTVPSLARVGGLTERGTRVLLDALVFLGLLTKVQNEYSLSPTAEAFLVKGKPPYYGDAMLGDFAWDARGALSRILRTGKPIGPAPFSDAFEPLWASVNALYLADWERQVENVDALWERVGIAAEQMRKLRILDLAGGAGFFSFVLAKKHSSNRVTLIERPMVIAYARQLADKMGVEGQVSLLAQDPLNPELKAHSFDLVVFNNVTHFLSTEQNIGLFRKAYEALDEEGRLILHAPVADEDRKGPGEVPLMGAEMLLFSVDGDVYTYAEYRSMLEAAGYFEVANHRDDWGLISGRRTQNPQSKPEKWGMR
jgi:SAM-dependent methyltransferase